MTSRIPNDKKRTEAKEKSGTDKAAPAVKSLGTPKDIEAFAKAKREDSKNTSRWESEGGKS